MKKKYFDDLLKTFKTQNNFIQEIGEIQYKTLNKKV